MITVGRMAERYSLLPHQVEQNATTYDLMISDVLAAYEKYEQAKNKKGPIDPSVYNLTTEQLLAIKNKNKK